MAVNKNRYYNLPKDSAQALSDVSVDNPYLRLYRYSVTEDGKKIKIAPQILMKEGISLKNPPWRDLLSKLNQRMRLLAGRLPGYWEFQFQPMNRLAIGLGGMTPYSNINVMTLHPVYGVPYLPGSALKGLLRHCWPKEYGEDEAPVTELFGAAGTGDGNEKLSKQGKLIFFDSFPRTDSPGNIVFDVVTPHYREYYKGEGKQNPTDDQNPVPILFSCVEKAVFQILIGAVDQETQTRYQHKLTELVAKAFSQYGIGAKTALGYGLGDVEIVQIQDECKMKKF